MAKTVAVVKEEKKDNDQNSKIITEPNPNDAVSKQPEQQKEISISDAPTESKDVKEVHLNHVGQKLDKPLSEADHYLTPDGKIMTVQMEEENQVFAGEHGKNAEWFPKSVVSTWQKHEPVKVKEEKETK